LERAVRKDIQQGADLGDPRTSRHIGQRVEVALDLEASVLEVERDDASRERRPLCLLGPVLAQQGHLLGPEEQSVELEAQRGFQSQVVIALDAQGVLLAGRGQIERLTAPGTHRKARHPTGRPRT